QIQKEKASISATISEFKGLRGKVDDADAMIELVSEDPSDKSMLAELGAAIAEMQPKVDDLETRTLLSGEHDTRNCFLNINSGAGGTESQDWAEMLLRMYRRWCDKKGFANDVVDISLGEEAGIKSATVLVKGPMAYGLLRAEVGVHRLVRISPY